MLKDEALLRRLPFPEGSEARFDTYLRMLCEYNETVNLTAITKRQDIEVKHFLDSLSAEPYLGKGARVIDVGSGAGFPGLPLALVREDIHMTLLDSLKKRVTFLRTVCQALERTDICCFHARAEDAAHDGTLRECFDVAVSRAVAPLCVLCEYCLPFVRVGGRFLALKGPSPEDEVREAEGAIALLGGKIAAVDMVDLPGDIRHSLVCIEKISQTPPLYPRKAGKPAKSPLK